MNDKSNKKAKAETSGKEPNAIVSKPSGGPAEASMAQDKAPMAAPALAIKHSAVKAEPSKTPAIEEAIEIALEAASTAVDSAHEIQRLRSESFKLITETRKNSKLLLYTSTLIFGLAAIAVFGSLVYFKRAMNEFDLITKVNRDALLVFAGEINGLVSTGKKIDDNVKASSEALQAITVVNGDLSNKVQSLTASLAIANANIAKLSSYEKELSGVRQSLDELSSATRTANARAADMRAAATRPPPTTPAAKPKPQRQATPRSIKAKPTKAGATAPRDNMIQYP